MVIDGLEAEKAHGVSDETRKQVDTRDEYVVRYTNCLEIEIILIDILPSLVHNRRFLCRLGTLSFFHLVEEFDKLVFRHPSS